MWLHSTKERYRKDNLSSRLATRFASVTLELYRSEGSFEIELSSENERDEVAAAFQAMGVEVVKGERPRRLIVTCVPATNEPRLAS